ncbi:MAG: Fic family protein [Thermoleophilia bacterium]|nr:Fic family protein [Thermoleophilia bacterium]
MYAFHSTSLIETGLARLVDLKRRLDSRGPLPRIWLGMTRRELEAEAVAASTSMEGVSVTVDEVRRILAGDRPSSVAPQDVAFLEGYRDAQKSVLNRADDSDFEWQTELILGIHYRVMGEDHSLGAGRLRQTQNRLVDVAGRRQVFLAPPPGEVPRLVAELAAWVQEQGITSAPLVAAVVHCRLAGIHPFSDGNGRRARILASVAMYRGGYRSPEFTSLEEWWGGHAGDYYRAFECLGSEWVDEVDVTPFVEAHIQAQVGQVEALSLRQATERTLWLALDDATRSVATAVNDLARLESNGLLRALGAGRSRRYVAGERLVGIIAEGTGVAPVVDGKAPLESQRDVIIVALAERVKQGGLGL